VTDKARELRSFIVEHTRPDSPPLVPDIRLHLVAELDPLWEATKIELDNLLRPPPFWALAWSGGQALARYVLDHPEMVQARRVLDFAAGSGIAAIAAAQAGAARVTAADTDEFAAVAISLNAELNDVTIAVSCDDLIDSDDGWDVILAGDICYERPFAEKAIGWMRGLAGRGAVVLLGDPGRDYLPLRGLSACANYDVAVPRALESRLGRKATVWRVEHDATS
jgi:predicted nicotinamide N-methyase